MKISKRPNEIYTDRARLLEAIEEAENELAIFEKQDEEDGTYTEDFYQIAVFNFDTWDFEEI